MPGKGLFLCFYEVGKENLARQLPALQLDRTENFRLRDTIATLLAAGVALTYETPFEILKQNQQAHSDTPKENFRLLRTLSGRFRTTPGAVVYEAPPVASTLTGLGLRFRGISPFVTRELCLKLMQYPIYDELKRQLCEDASKPNNKEAVFCGAVAPLLPGTLTTPIDVVKTRMMVDTKCLHLGMGGVFKRILMEERGVRGLF